LALALCIGIGLAFAVANLRSWELEDAEAYWNAAHRLREGMDLYVPVDPNADEVLAYRYAPWLAWLWVPLTYLPKAAVQVGWSTVLVGAVVASLVPVLRVRTMAAICIAALLGGLLLRTASTGNVHALVIAALVWGLPRRSGPIWLGLAASLKVVPILYAIVYVRQGQLGRAALAVAVTAILVAPALLYDLSAYPTEAGESLSLLSNLGWPAFAAGAVLCIGVAWWFGSGRYRWPLASLAVVAALPRLELYSLTYFLVGTDQARVQGGRTEAIRRRPR
jgi:hypothetical protein